MGGTLLGRCVWYILGLLMHFKVVWCTPGCFLLQFGGFSVHFKGIFWGGSGIHFGVFMVQPFGGRDAWGGGGGVAGCIGYFLEDMWGSPGFQFSPSEGLQDGRHNIAIICLPLPGTPRQQRSCSHLQSLVCWCAWWLFFDGLRAHGVAHGWLRRCLKMMTMRQ